MKRKLIIELEWPIEVEENGDIMAAIGRVMDQHGNRPFRDVLCEMRYVTEREVEPWESQGF